MDVPLTLLISHREGMGKKKRVPIGKESVGHSVKKCDDFLLEWKGSQHRGCSWSGLFYI